MKFYDVTQLHEKLRKNLGDDLVYSLAYDNGKYYLAISVHKSKDREYDHGRNIQSCIIDELHTDIDVLVDEIVQLYSNVLIKK